MKHWHDMTQAERREHVMIDGHDCNTCAVCLAELQRVGIKTLRTIVSLRKPEKDIIQNVSDLIAAI